jgi:hypothetical protein
VGLLRDYWRARSAFDIASGASAAVTASTTR